MPKKLKKQPSTSSVELESLLRSSALKRLQQEPSVRAKSFAKPKSRGKKSK